MAINKVIYGTTVLVDLTGDTVSADTLLKGYTAHDAGGNEITGTAESGGSGTIATAETQLSSAGTKLTFTISGTPKWYAIIAKGTCGTAPSWGSSGYYICSVLYDGSTTTANAVYYNSGTVLANTSYLSHSVSGSTLTISSSSTSWKFYTCKYELLYGY